MSNRAPAAGAADGEHRHHHEYLPHNGDHSYDVRHYDLELTYQIDTNQLRGRAVVDAVALVELSELRVDLHGLRVTKVAIAGATGVKYAVKRHHLVIKPKRAVPVGRPFRLTISYQGSPSPIPDGADEMGWEELDDGVLVAGQPGGAPSWFPCNDRPSNKASYRMEITVASTYHVLANGTLTSTRRGASATTWVYEQPEPMATYLATVQIGRYVAVPGAAVPSTAGVPISAVLPERLLGRYDATFARQPEMMQLFTRLFGPYPFAGYTLVVTEDELEIPLEAQGMSVFGSNFLGGGWENVRLAAHEMAHQWFGNSLTVVSWRDIWLHEGFACYSEWLWSQESGSRSADDRARGHWARLAGKAQDLRLGDPGPDDMFDDRVYKRGALLLHALRLTIGDADFFVLLRTWVDRNAYGSVTTEMFVELAEKVAARPLQALFTRWLWDLALPDLPAPGPAAAGVGARPGAGPG